MLRTIRAVGKRKLQHKDALAVRVWNNKAVECKNWENWHHIKCQNITWEQKETMDNGVSNWFQCEYSPPENKTKEHKYSLKLKKNKISIHKMDFTFVCFIYCKKHIPIKSDISWSNGCHLHDSLIFYGIQRIRLEVRVESLSILHPSVPRLSYKIETDFWSAGFQSLSPHMILVSSCRWEQSPNSFLTAPS